MAHSERSADAKTWKTPLACLAAHDHRGADPAHVRTPHHGALPGEWDSEILEVLVYEADGHGSFAHGRRHALDRAASDVAGCEDAGPAGPEKGSATERPSLVLGPVEDGAGPGEDEVVIV